MPLRLTPENLFDRATACDHSVPRNDGGAQLSSAPCDLIYVRNSFQSSTSAVFRMNTETGSSFGARGTVSSFRPASCGRRSALRWFTSLADQTRFSQASLPPRERGTTWSRLPSSGWRIRPVYWQRLPSRSRIARVQSFGRFFGTLA